MTQLDWEPEAPSASIGVSVSGGVVTLTGFVNKYSEKLAAEKAVKLARGVRGVANDLVVRLFSQLTNMDIVKTALRTLENDVRVPADKVIVTVSALFVGDRIVVEAADGNVTLSGHVSSMIEREEAERIARAAPGAARVDNHLIVTP
ncbi:MAG: BON domain-containing protein [Blastocatellia bacterium]|nr:BON domain-containing protein [Blastocatellia bacterium]